MSVTLHPHSRATPGLRVPSGSELRVPGDKSISHRSLLFGALASGKTVISNLLRSGDVHSTWECMTALGARIEERGGTVTVEGLGGGGLKSPHSVLDCGNSGTTMRLLMGILSGHALSATLTGDDSLKSRPMKRIAEPLRRMGARIELTRENYAPLTLHGKSPLAAIDYELPVASAQLKSALLLAGVFAEGVTRLTGLIKSRDHTERLLPHFGVELEATEKFVKIRGGQKLKAAEMLVPGDISSAAFWMAAASLVPGSELEIEGVSLNESRTGILGALTRMGAKIEVERQAEHPEPIGRIRIRSSRLTGTVIEGEEIPSLIDEIPIISILAACAEGETVIRGAEELRVKETDRIEAIAMNLRAMGVVLETHPDGLSVRGPQKLKGAKINSFHDHRIAMAFSIAALVADGPTEIQGARCVEISYPTFFETLRSLNGG